MIESARPTGLEIFEDMPWGTHFCQFYQTNEELLEVLANYFWQGLKNNEFCVWVASAPVGVQEARAALLKIVSDLDDRIARGQMEILDYRDWYLAEGQFDAPRVLQGCLDKEQTALARGYEGLRGGGDMSWLDKSTWRAFADYEAIVNREVGSHRIVTVCTYPLDRCGALEVFDVLRHHQFALIKQNGEWHAMESPQNQKMREFQRRSELERETTIEFLHLVNTIAGTRELIQAATGFFQTQSGCEAVGIRLRDGNDFPYYETRGFPQEFVAAENSLCVPCENGEPKIDCDGNPVLECMCGNVLCGRFDAARPFFTAAGSFWTNCTTELLATTTDEDRQARTRNRCNGEGYESVALIRLYSGREIFGLLQLNDHRQGCFSVETIALWERLAGYLAVALAKSLAEERLRERESVLRGFFENPGVMRGVVEVVGDDILHISDNAMSLAFFGHSQEAMHNRLASELGVPKETVRMWIEHYEESKRTGDPVRFEYRHAAENGENWLLATVGFLGIVPNGCARYVYIAIDITERKRLEQEKLEMERRLLHSQKLESLGVLAGGIAHDFNNILAGIMGYSDLALLQLPDMKEVHKSLAEIKRASQRAADLTRQMLAYSGKGQFLVEPLNLSQIIEDSKKMLAISVSKKAALQYRLASDLPTVLADAAQIGQILMNLVINASESLGEQSGAIHIVTKTMDCDENSLAKLGLNGKLPHGRYVCLEVADTGCGMDKQTLEKIFDPFFTTKFTGRGLGLAAVHGIVRGHKGAIGVSSETGQGTTFRVLFPASDLAARTTSHTSAASSWKGNGTVLVVDDEEAICSLARQMIERVGCSVLTASGGHDAVELFRKRHSEVDCVLLDLTMPDLDGTETFRQLRTIRSDVRVILSSGFSEEAAMKQFADLELAGFLHKPFEFNTLLARLRDVLEEGRQTDAVADAVCKPADCGNHPTSHATLSCDEAVLVVDDEEISRSVTKMMFELAGFPTLTAKDGEEALCVYGEHRDRIACVFLDLNLPGIDGEETLHELRRQNADIRFILASGGDVSETAQRCAGPGLVGLVEKPEPLDAVIARLQEVLADAATR